MAKKSMIERLALPMFVCGIIAMVSSATISLGTQAVATSPIEFQKVTMKYLSSDYSVSGSACGSAQDLYSSNRSRPSFSARNLSSSSSNKTFECTATFYVVTNVSIPTPKPVPTITIIERPQPVVSPKPTRYPTPRPTVYPTSYPTPTVYPTRYPSPTPTATRRPAPTFVPTPAPSQDWWRNPTPAPTPTKVPRI